MSEIDIPSVMPVLVWEAPRQMVLRQGPVPAPLADEVLVRVAFAGICGSELSGYLGHNALRVPPLVMGHEFSGVIVALGSQVVQAYPQLREGMLVTANPLGYCGECVFCQRGLNQLCVQRKLIGAHRPGAFAGYMSLPAKQVLPLPAGLSLRTAALSEPVACAVRIVESAGSIQGEVVFVAGAGTIGLFTLQVLLLQGAQRVFISDINAERRAAAAKLGGEALDPQAADVVKIVREATGGYGAAAAVDAVGMASTRAQCIAATRSTGTVILSGLHEESGSLPSAEVIRREIILRGSFAYSPQNFGQAVNLLAQNAVRLDEWMVQAPLAEGGAWFDRLVAGSGTAKVLLTPGTD
jgi:threonine dehydrogenase-like Zn-dependent dehydrogenase